MSTALSAIRQQVGRLLGAGDTAMFMGTPAATFSVNGFTCSLLNQYENDYFNEWWLRFYAGTHKDTTRTVSDFAQSGGTFTIAPDLSSAVDATDLFELHRDFSPEELNAAINLAIQLVESEALAGKVDETLVVNDLLTDGLLESWTDSSTLASWSTTGTGTLARESTIKWEGTYSAKLTNTVSNAFGITQSVTNYSLYAGAAASVSARVYATAADRVRIRLTDGVTTWNSDYHTGAGWEELTIEGVTLSSSLSALTVSARIETGSAISAYVDRVYLAAGSTVYEYTLPSGFYALADVYQEDSTPGRFPYSGRIAADRGWRLLKNGSTVKLWIDPNYNNLVSGRRLRLEGQQRAGQLTLDADTTELRPGYIVPQAVALLHLSRHGEVSKAHFEQARLMQALADRERLKVRVPAMGWHVP